MSDLEIEVRRIEGIGDAALVVLSGPIDARTVMSFKNRLDAERAGGVRTFVLDLERVPYINSTGLSYLISLSDTGDPGSPGVLLVRTQAKVKVLFDMMGLGTLFRFHGSVEEALAGLGGGPVSGRPRQEPEGPPPPVVKGPAPVPIAPAPRVLTPGPLAAAGRPGPPAPAPIGGPAGAREPRPAERPAEATPTPGKIPSLQVVEIRPPSRPLEAFAMIPPAREEAAAVLLGFLCAGLAAAGLWTPGPSFRWASEGDFFAAAARHKPSIDVLIVRAGGKGEVLLKNAADDFARAYETGDRRKAQEAADRLKEALRSTSDPALREEALRLDRQVFSLAGAPIRNLWDRRPLLDSALQGIVCLFLSCLGVLLLGGRLGSFAAGFPFVFALGWLARLIAGNIPARSLGLDPLLAALLVGLFVGNTIPVPRWIREAARSGYYLRAGLVVLGADLLWPETVSLPGLLFSVLLLLTVGLAGYGICRLFRLEEEFAVVLSASLPSGGMLAAIGSVVAVRADRRRLAYLAPLFLLGSILSVWAVPWIGPGSRSAVLPAIAGPGDPGPGGGAPPAAGESRDLLIPLLVLALSLFWTRRRAARLPGDRTGRFGRLYPWSIAGFLVLLLLFGAVLPALRPGVPRSAPPVLHEVWLVLAFLSIGLETRWGELIRLQEGRPFLAFLSVQILQGLAALGLGRVLLGGADFY